MAVLYCPHFAQFFDSNGDPLSGGLLYTYEAGTTTPKDTYSAADGLTPNANPIVLDAAGRATLFLNGAYKFRLETSAAVLVRETDNVTAFATSESGVDDIPTNFTADTIASGDSIIFSDVSDGGTTKRTTFGGALDAVQYNRNYTNGRILFGLEPSNNGTDAVNDVDISAGSCVASTGTTVISLGSSITKRLDATWAVGTGNGGLDTGAVANGTYYIWAIRRSDTGVVDVLFSLSNTSPTMPTDYDARCLIGTIIRDAGASAYLGVGKYYANPENGNNLIMTRRASASSSLDFTSIITSQYNEYMFVLEDMVPGTDDTRLFIRTSTDNGATFDSGTDYAVVNKRAIAGSATVSAVDSFSGGNGIVIGDATATNGFGNAAGESFSGVVKLFNPLGTSLKKIITFDVAGFIAAGNLASFNGAGARNATADIDAVRFLMASGNIASGVIRCYGIK